ncbi:MAG: ATP-dependent helicase, partial [Micromonosporaceae bacterium]
MTAQATAAPPAHRLVRRPPPVPPQQLSDPQLQVAKHRDGPLLVVGGPGAGKTAALVESVVARAVEGADPERILVLTFGRRGAQRLRARISARIGAKIGVSGEPAVRTFHGHAFGLLRLLAARRGEPPPRLLTGPEQDLVIRELLAAGGGDVGWPAALRPALRTRGFAGELRDLLSRASERGLGPAGLSELGRRLGREDWVAAGRFAQQYGDVLALRDGAARGSIGYDTSELIRAASAALIADPAAHAEERRRHQFTYVDELHDTDPAQLELLELTAGGGAHLVGFGDPDSSIFGFRGADPEGVLAFPERFRSVAGAAAPTIALLDNWRAAPTLRQAVDRVASRLRGPGRRRLRRTESVSPGQADAAVLKIADSGTNLQSEATPAPEIEILADGGDVAEPAGGGQIEVRLLRSRPQEAAHIAYQLRAAHLLDKVPWSRMAVLMRSAGQQLAGMRRALAQAGVPVRVEAEDLPLAAQPVVASLLSLVRCGLRPERLDEEAAVALLHSPFGGADPLAERRLRQGLRAQAIAAGEAKPSGALLVEALADPTELAAVSERWAKPAARVAELLQVVRDADEAGASAEDVLWAVWKASGLSERWGAASARGGHRGAAADRDLDAIVALFDAAAWFASRLPGAGAEVFSEHVMGQQLPADTLAPTADQGDAVRLLTVHAAKGLEWDLVVIPGVQEGRWPDLRLRGSVLGSEQLVDHLAGRAAPGEGWRPVTARLDEERRLF